MIPIANIQVDNAAQLRRSKIETLARAMCSQISGLDPDALIYGGMGGGLASIPTVPQYGPKGCIILPKPETCWPAWNLFYREAACAIDTIEAWQNAKPAEAA